MFLAQELLLNHPYKLTTMTNCQNGPFSFHIPEYGIMDAVSMDYSVFCVPSLQLSSLSLPLSPFSLSLSLSLSCSPSLPLSYFYPFHFPPTPSLPFYLSPFPFLVSEDHGGPSRSSRSAPQRSRRTLTQQRSRSTRRPRYDP